MRIKLVKVSLMAYLFLFLCTSIQAQGLPAWEKKEYEDIFQLYLELKNNPTSAADIYINAYKTGLKSLLTETPNPIAAIATLDDYAVAIEDLSFQPELRQYYLNDIHLLSAFLQLKAGHELKFMWMMNQLYNRSQKLIENYPEFAPAKKNYALLQIMVGSVPDQYKWIFNLLGFDGDVDHGVQMLKQLSEKAEKYAYENLGLYILITNYLQPNISENNLKLLDSHLSKHNDHYLLHFVNAISLIKQHRSEDARVHLKILLENRNVPLANYYLAETFLHQSQYKNAIENYNAYLTNSKSRNLVKDSYFKIFASNYIMGNVDDLDKLKETALISGTLESEADKNAHNILESPLPHPLILKIRFSTDGGFYSHAFKSVNQGKLMELNERDKVELIYRQARLNHLNGNILDAITNYKETLSKEDKRYFKPNSALQLGYIYSDQGEYALAKQYFEKVLEFKNYAYENSLKSKARSALKKINK